MKAIQLQSPASLDNLKLVDLPDPTAPAADEITVRLRASSLNYHDYVVVKGVLPTAENRIPMSDGAGEVTAVGEGVTEFKVGDAVVSTFFPIGSTAHRQLAVLPECRAMALTVMLAKR